MTDDEPTLSEDDAAKLGAAGTALLYLARDASLWRDYKALIARARVLAEDRVRRGSGEAG